jgi:lipopolysaccharide export system protein LptA
MTRPRCFFRRPAAAILWLVMLLVALPPTRLAAQLMNPMGAADSQLPLVVQAESGIEWQQDAKLYIARGNAVAIRGPSEIHADTLIAHYREVKARGAAGNPVPSAGATPGGNTEIYRVEAEGHVTMLREGRVVVGDQAIYDLDQGIVVVTGKNLKMTTATDIITARDSLEWYDQKQIAVARGDAVAIRNGKTIKADILTAYVVKNAPAQGKAPPQRARPAPGKGGKPQPTPASALAGPGTGGAESKISRVDAQGHVVVTNGLDTGRGDYGVYNADTGIVTLIDHVVIARGKDVITGQYGIMDLDKNVSRMMPAPSTSSAQRQRVQGLFVREEGGGAGRNPASPAPKKP